jgi:hypothetical protein
MGVMIERAHLGIYEELFLTIIFEGLAGKKCYLLKTLVFLLDAVAFINSLN